MARDLKLFVVDTGPLITLAVAHALDSLLYVDADLVIPDAVLHEATDEAARLGAQDIIDWIKGHRSRIEIAPTRASEILDAARATIPGLRQPDLGERAAVEVIEEPDRLLEGERGVLLCEETAVLKRVTVRDRARIVELSTLDFPRILGGERRIQSADRVFDLAARPDASRRASTSSSNTMPRRAPPLIPAVADDDSSTTGYAARAAARIRAGQRSRDLTAGISRC